MLVSTSAYVIVPYMSVFVKHIIYQTIDKVPNKKQRGERSLYGV